MLMVIMSFQLLDNGSSRSLFLSKKVFYSRWKGSLHYTEKNIIGSNMTQNDFRIEVYDIRVKILSQHGNGDDFWHQPLRTSPHSLALLVALAKKTQSLFHQWLKNYLGCWWNLSSLRMICRMWKVGTIFALPCSCVYSIWNLHVKTKSYCIFHSLIIWWSIALIKFPKWTPFNLENIWHKTTFWKIIVQ